MKKNNFFFFFSNFCLNIPHFAFYFDNLFYWIFKKKKNSYENKKSSESHINSNLTEREFDVYEFTPTVYCCAFGACIHKRYTEAPVTHTTPQTVSQTSTHKVPQTTTTATSMANRKFVNVLAVLLGTLICMLGFFLTVRHFYTN